MPGKRTSALCLALVAGFSLAAMGCKNNEAEAQPSEHPQGEHPQGEHPQGEHPSEHPRGEHPARN